jgi:hypothetical protein
VQARAFTLREKLQARIDCTFNWNCDLKELIESCQKNESNLKSAKTEIHQLVPQLLNNIQNFYSVLDLTDDELSEDQCQLLLPPILTLFHSWHGMSQYPENDGINWSMIQIVTAIQYDQKYCHLNDASTTFKVGPVVQLSNDQANLIKLIDQEFVQSRTRFPNGFGNSQNKLVAEEDWNEFQNKFRTTIRKCSQFNNLFEDALEQYSFNKLSNQLLYFYSPFDSSLGNEMEWVKEKLSWSEVKKMNQHILHQKQKSEFKPVLKQAHWWRSTPKSFSETQSFFNRVAPTFIRGSGRFKKNHRQN